MRKKFILMALSLAFIVSVLAYGTNPFPGWGRLTEMSPDIIIARSIETDNPFAFTTNRVSRGFQGLYENPVEVFYLLKAATNSYAGRLSIPRLGTATVLSEYNLSQEQYYLIFSLYDFGGFQALEKYRVIPLGTTSYSTMSNLTNDLRGKKLEDQIQILFKYSSYYLSNNIAFQQEEKQRIEEAIQK